MEFTRTVSAAVTIPRIRAAFWTGLVVAVVLVLAQPTPASAQAPEELKGNWSGVADVDGRNVPVKLTVTAVEIGEKSGEMAWRGSKNCLMVVEYAGPRPGKYIFDVTETDAPWCDLYWRGAISVVFDSSSAQSLALEMSDRQGGGTVTGQLNRDAP